LLIDHWQRSARSGETRGASAAVLPDMCVLTFNGPDVIGFLQGYLTIDLERLEEGSCRLAALTNIKGRVVANGWCCLRDSETVSWVIHASLGERVLEFLKPYLAFARTEAGLKVDDHVVIGMTGTDAVPPTVRVISDQASLDQFLSEHHPVEEWIWQAACIDTRTVLVTAATAEQFLPQMIGLVDAGAVNFDKGCYLGQEVVARAQHRGRVKRELVPLETSDDAEAAQPGSRLTDDSGRESGVIVASVHEPAGDRRKCLAVVRSPREPRYDCQGTSFS